MNTQSGSLNIDDLFQSGDSEPVIDVSEESGTVTPPRSQQLPLQPQQQQQQKQRYQPQNYVPGNSNNRVFIISGRIFL